MDWWFVLIMFCLGAGLGSFLGCQAWRLYYFENGKKKLGKWSVCLNCNHRLQWYENIPILSWVLLRGKCKKCGKKIGAMEILVETLTGVSFAAIGLLMSPDMAWFEFVNYGLVLIFILCLGFLAIYDGMWGELPNFMITTTIIVGVVIMIWSLIFGGFEWIKILDIVGAIAILFGVYFILWKISGGKWVGDGDAWLGLAIALVLGNSWLALWILLVSNFLGLILSIKKAKKNRIIYFGPFLAIAFVIVYCLKDFLLELL